MKHIKFFLVALMIAMPVSFSADAQDMNSWKKALVKQIRKHQKYPRSAMNREIEGRAIVRIVFNADGSIASHEIVESTGAKVLDREIPRILQKMKLPALPADQAAPYSIRVPFSWVLG